MKTILPGFSLLSTICFLAVSVIPYSTFSQNIDYGKTYYNVTKGVTGGTVEPNDIIEIRATFVVKSGAIADSCGFFDVIPAGTIYVPGSLAVLTNEGKIYKTFTDAPNDDCGRIIGTSVRINLGFNPFDFPATAYRRGTVRAAHRPSFYGGTCIMIASYRVRVTAPYGTIINVGGGSATYKIRGVAGINTINFNTNRITIFQNSGICANSIGGNALGAEFNGTFGNGKFRNRGTSASVPASYTYQIFDANSPQDYNYGIANNTSVRANYTTSNAWPKPDVAPSHRVFGVWDIIGDHTGAVNPFLGNPAADTVVRNNGGYMLVINASYKTDSAFQHTISNLCPNTYYEISAWFRNICSKCGCDSTGKGATSTGYIPTAPGDSSGVYPSLTFDVNGSDYYSTGLIKYTGQWIKKGFTYLTGPTETSFVLTVKNNAPGGGGNDWAIDDISVATCTPNLDMKPSPTVSVCYGNNVNMYCDVRSYFANYQYYEWQKSTDGGASWTSTGIGGVGTPVLVSGQWQYTAYYPPFTADSGAHNAMYRIKVASSATNLNNASCSFSASSLIQVYVNNCMTLLDLKLTSFEGKNEKETAKLWWSVENQTNASMYVLEKSSDGLHFEPVTQFFADAGVSTATYDFTDPAQMQGTVFYRLKLIEGTKHSYSKTIPIYSETLKIALKNVKNPFNDYITFDLHSPSAKRSVVQLYDAFGRMVKQKDVQLSRGLNRVTFTQLDMLPSAGYVLRVETDGQILNERVIKTH
jgi:hypothetical protein